jgi:hypothetical protein
MISRVASNTAMLPQRADDMAEIKIDDQLPAGLKLEIYIEQDKVRHQLIETGFGDMAQEFLARVLANSKKAPLQTWLEWEGYWLDEADETHQTLFVLGVLYFKGLLYVRAMITRHVPLAQLDAARHGLFLMIDEYLDKLRLTREQDQNN